MRRIFFYFVCVLAAGVIAIHAQAASKLVAFSPDGEQIAIVNEDGELSVWGIATRQAVWSVQSPVDDFDSVAWSPDGTRLATNAMKSNDGLRIWDSANGRLIAHNEEVGDPDGGYGVVKWSPDGTKIATVQSTGSATIPAHVWSATNDEYSLLSTLSEAGQQDFDIAWSPDSNQIAVSGFTGLYIASDLALETPNVQHLELGYATRKIDWSPDGNYLAIIRGSWTPYELVKEVQIYDFREARAVLILPSSSAVAVGWNFKGTRLGIIANDAVNIWDARGGTLLETFPTTNTSFSWNPTDGRLAYIGEIVPSAAERTQSIVSDVQIVTPIS